ncbi:TATA element modulatory factor 1 DNA binding-domain-containing protein [Aspergillus granulosus]|uniref:TATA element modulatory factor 1 DNA binding-domain-containing protein n=1 Tax=Aspergillus granulosus TaxID=176169 RepID=A0ABR4H1S4_9EURO
MSQNRWKVGSLFQQAVAGVESRLDQMLAEEEDAKRQQTKPAPAHSRSNSLSGNVSRSSSSAKKNDRLQERLARAMAKSNSPNNGPSSSSPAGISPVTSPVPGNDARTSMDIEASLDSLSKDTAPALDTSTSPPVVAEVRISHDSSRSARDSIEVTMPTSNEKDSPSPTLAVEVSAVEDEPSYISEKPTVTINTSHAEDAKTPSNDEEAVIEPSLVEKSATESQAQDDMHEYIERIDALQSKLKYLAQEAAESARRAAATAEPGSVEKQLREREEKIALLLEEGQRLSKTEMDHRTLIKKLRQQMAENHKVQTEAKKKNDRLEKDLANAEARAKRAEAAEKRATGSLSAQTKTARDLEAVTAERNALSQTVQEMKGQLARAVSRADSAEAKANSEALEREKQRAERLEEDLSSAKIEREISEEKMRREINSLKGNIEQEKERARILEAELKGEQSVLESKMESLRSRAEEASSGVASDAQVKLLRQIETLQTQYAVASENWQALEVSLLSRLANVEKERDEVARREGEARRKIREVVRHIILILTVCKLTGDRISR